VTQIKVLSAPCDGVDNEPARLQGQTLVPVLTQSQQSTLSANAPIVNSVDYRDTGVIMLVTLRQFGRHFTPTSAGGQRCRYPSTATSVRRLSIALIRTRVAVQDGRRLAWRLIRDKDTQKTPASGAEGRAGAGDPVLWQSNCGTHRIAGVDHAACRRISAMRARRRPAPSMINAGLVHQDSSIAASRLANQTVGRVGQTAQQRPFVRIAACIADRAVDAVLIAYHNPCDGIRSDRSSIATNSRQRHLGGRRWGDL
jgi:hypothetical protein